MILRCLILFVFTVGAASAQILPRTDSGKPNLQGIWQAATRASYNLEDSAARHDMPATRSVVDGGNIPYQESALERRQANYQNRGTEDPFASCFLPGVPRIMALESPFHFFQTDDHVAITFEWQQVYRIIYIDDGPAMYAGIPSFMGHSRGRWDGDVFVVEVTDQNDRTWLDASGNFHSGAVHVTERYRLLDADTIEYEATLEDPAVYTEPWTIRFELRRQTQFDRILENQCQAEKEEASGLFEREDHTWYPAPIPEGNEPFDAGASEDLPLPDVPPDILRFADGTPDISGFFMADGGGANYGLEQHPGHQLLPPSRGHLIDPADGVLPYQDWARAERIDREMPYRGYDDPTAHCIVASIPRSHYVPAPFYILQPPGYVVILYERMSWRQIALNRNEHLPESIRLWMGDSIGRWEGDTLVVETRNNNGKAWLNEAGDVVSHLQATVEKFTPVSPTEIAYRATVTDPIPYTRPWTMEMPFHREEQELLEVACLEGNNDLQHLKDVRDAHRASQNEGG